MIALLQRSQRIDSRCSRMVVQYDGVAWHGMTKHWNQRLFYGYDMHILSSIRRRCVYCIARCSIGLAYQDIDADFWDNSASLVT